ncbi:MAG TPA: hypothetical protein VJV78_02135 [Polyangiales bacterium]|nr:hypothetical protein [Polyangiales bacterium]
MKRVDQPHPSSNLGGGPARQFSEAELLELEARYPEGLSTQDVVELFSARGERLSEATFRKYVQLGLLPRSVRVGRKGKHRGSQGRYPVAVIRQIDAVRALMAQGYTIQDIQRELLSLRTDIDALGQKLASVLSTMEQAAAVGDDIAARAISDARQVGDALIERLRAIEQRLAMRARMARAAV